MLSAPVASRLLVVFAVALIPVACGGRLADRAGGARQASLQGSPFGIFYGLTTYKDRPTTKYMTELGADWTRQTLDWNGVEPKRGQLKWGTVDGAVAIVDKGQQESRPVNILVTLRGRSSWAGARPVKSREASAPPANLQEYYQFVNATVKRARGRIHYWQIDNEVHYPFFWQGTPDEYIQVLRTAYRAVKDADPDAKVVLAGIDSLAVLGPMFEDEIAAGQGDRALDQYRVWAENNDSPRAKLRPSTSDDLLRGVRRQKQMNEFVRRLLSKEAAQYFDVVDIHLYHPYALIPAVIEWAKADMAKEGYSKPVWVTETSGPRYPELWPNDQVGERRQAEEVVKRYVLAIASGAERVFWYVLATPAHQAKGEWSHTGLLRSDLSKRPAYSAYRLMTEMLRGTSAVRSLDLGGGVQAFEFTLPQGSVYVLWCDKGTTVKLPIGPCRLEITDALGRRTTQETQQKELALTLSSTPIFVHRQGL